MGTLDLGLYRDFNLLYTYCAYGPQNLMVLEPGNYSVVAKRQKWISVKQHHWNAPIQISADDYKKLVSHHR